MVLGNDLQRLLFISHGPSTLTTAYITKVNPYLLKEIMRDIAIDDNWILGLGAIAGCQGSERLHAFLKVMFRCSTLLF